MGLFGNSDKIKTPFRLPAVSPGECPPLRLPCMTEEPDITIWYPRGSFNPREDSEWLDRIEQSDGFWNKSGTDLTRVAWQLASYAFDLENLTPSEEVSTGVTLAMRTGLMAGLFEQLSETTDPTKCHPTVLGALGLYQMLFIDEKPIDLPPSSARLRECALLAGYVAGKTPKPSNDYVFSRWRA